MCLQMIPWIRKSKKNNKVQMRLFNEPYLIINIFLAGVIVMIFVYSVFFSPEKDDYPVTCIHEKINGKPCVSCGLSHSFSLILRGRIDEAYKWNKYGMRVILFFASQLLLRIVFSRIYIRYQPFRKQLILFDITGSSLIFIITFMPFLIYILKLF